MNPERPARFRPTSTQFACGTLVFLAVVARIAFGWTRLEVAPADPDRYLPFARALCAGEGFVFNGRPTAYRPPLYPILLAPLWGAFGDGKAFHAALLVVQSLIGGATTWLAMRGAAEITRKFSSGSTHRSASLVAGFITAFDPVLLAQAPLVMTETLAAMLLTAAVHETLRNRPVRSGLWFGAAALCRPSLLACLGLTVLARLIPSEGTPAKDRVAAAAKTVLACLIALLPWSLRNYAVFGEPVWTTTHGGYTFALANNPVYYDEVLFGPPGAIWSGPRQQAWMDTIGTDTIHMTEPAADRHLKSKTMAFVKANPNAFMRACIDREMRFWAVAPAAGVYGPRVRALCAIWTVPFWILVVAGFFRKRNRVWPARSAAAVVLGLVAVHLVYWTDIRMRAPIVPTLAIMAATGALSVVNSIKIWSSSVPKAD